MLRKKEKEEFLSHSYPTSAASSIVQAGEEIPNQDRAPKHRWIAQDEPIPTQGITRVATTVLYEVFHRSSHVCINQMPFLLQYARGLYYSVLAPSCFAQWCCRRRLFLSVLLSTDYNPPCTISSSRIQVLSRILNRICRSFLYGLQGLLEHTAFYWCIAWIPDVDPLGLFFISKPFLESLD